MSQGVEEGIKAKVRQRIEEAVRFAESHPMPSGGEAAEGVYAV
jgi:TPP-dependent pyruvate/acetoin dehydrogenase alpha subunit